VTLGPWLQLAGADALLPAFATAHSHAFQRGMRGLAQRPGPAGTDDFWTWREAMYRLALSLTPERVLAISRVAFRELRAAGTLTVGEFHYVHHQPDGTPYDDRTVMAEAVIEAAKAEGVRISLLRTIYHRGGPGKPAEGAQRRFSDGDLDDALRDVETLLARHGADADVRVGIAPHSVRAIPPAWLAPIAAFAERHALPLHMHVAEQPAEVAACVAETGRRPVELLAEAGLLGPRFVAVHATHLAPAEAELLGRAGAVACINPTTERDLGDGHPDLASLRAAGVRLCTGIDSHVSTDPFEEMRGIELGERLRTLRRVTDRTTSPTLAERLWRAASLEGARAVGFDDAGGSVVIDREALQLALVDDEHLLDALVFSAGPSVVKGVVPSGNSTAR
jgi:formimidoylglutamate deiminase